MTNDEKGRGNGWWNAVKTHCPAGHEYNAENTFMSQGKRKCRPCHNAARMRSYYKKSGEAVAS